MTDEELDAIRARLAGATAMPWEQGEPNGCTIYGDYGTYICETQQRGDAALIANAPADIANLLAEVERLRGTPAAPRPPRVEECAGCGGPFEPPERIYSEFRGLWHRACRLPDVGE